LPLADSTEENDLSVYTSQAKSKHMANNENQLAGSLAQNNQPALPQTTTGMRKAKASNNLYGFFNQNPSNGNNPNIQPGFLPGYAINPTTGRAYVKTKNGLQAINDQGVEEVAPEMYVLSAGDAIEATKLGLSAGKVGIHLLGDLAESTLPAVKKATSALVKRMGFWAGDPEQLAIRNRVLANIEQSQAASSASSFLRFSKRATAINFYLKNNFSIESTLAHMRGIDFNNAIEAVVLPKDTKAVQYMLPEQNIGNYFAPTGTSGSKLGIYTSGRMPVTFFATEDVEALQSTAASMADDYSMANYGWKIETEGGGTQYFSPFKDKWRME
jgi:hypothetical protein